MGIVGKLVGDLVAVASIAITSDAVRIETLVVAKELRRKRIGRFMLGELEQLARKMERDRLVVEQPGEAAEFLRRVGFHDEGGVMVRDIR
jgi:GNAT superfamily N-acetyltransferase